MSKYEWERGTLKIPTKAWKPLRDGLAHAFNTQQVKLFELALRFHEALTNQKKLAKRGTFKLDEAWSAMMHRSPSPWPSALDGHQERELVDRALFGVRTGARTKLLLPKKKDFPLAISTKTLHYQADDGDISLDPAKHEVRWNVSENNHAVESARDSYMGRAFFKLLGQIEWTRGSGGTFVGNDENNRDSDCEDGGGNYVTERFAMKTAAEKAEEARSRHRPFGGYSGMGYRYR